jgi:2-C-methyl-D-erythritol 4-phosphate cytidylyltransferase
VSTEADILILLAAGSAQRMQAVVDDKTTTLLAGKPVFLHSLTTFLKTGLIDRVIITYRDEAQLARLQSLIAQATLPSADIALIRGGATRQESVLAALEQCDGHQGLVHIHDSARPLVTIEAIKKVRQKALETGAAILAGKAADTIKISKSQHAAVESSPDRSLVWAAETPQVFRTATILKAYRLVVQQGRKVTDDSSAAECVGQEVSLVENPSVNFKITRPSDLVLAEAILAKQR